MFSFSGEDGDVTDEMTAPWEETTLQTILNNYEKKDIYNADEFGLFYQMLPKKTYHFKNEKCTGGKHSKIRLTGMAAANMMGDKLPMFVIGKAAKPRCFKNIRQLPCMYRGQKKSWMSSELFEQWVRELDRKFKLEGRKIALIIDNCPAHPHIDGLQAIELFFLPPNTTSRLQPMDQGVIRSLKAHYRKMAAQRIIDAIDQGKTLPKISILQAMKQLVQAWDAVTAQTIVNCFAKSGFTEQLNYDIEDDPFSDLMSTVDELRSKDSSQVPADVTPETIVSVDDDAIATQPYMSDQEIVDQILCVETPEIIVDEDDDDDVENVNDVEEEKPSSASVRAAMDTIISYSLFGEDREFKSKCICLADLLNKVLDEGKKQSTIHSFFTGNASLDLM